MRGWISILSLVSLCLVIACQGKEEAAEDSHGSADHDHAAENGDDLTEEGGETSFRPEDMADKAPMSYADWYEGESRIALFFDPDYTESSGRVEEGGILTVYVVGVWEAKEQMSAAEYQLDLPEGLEIIGHLQPDYVPLFLGAPDRGIKLAFIECQKGPMVLLNTITLRATSKVENAPLQITKSHVSQFLGFATCDEVHSLLNAEGAVVYVNP